MKAKILLDVERPKVPYVEVRELVAASGVEVTSGRADIGIVVGGDGLFGYFGRTEDIPLLFVGVRSDGPTGSKAFLASSYFDELGPVLRRIVADGYAVRESKRLRVAKNGQALGDVFTDVYLERGADSHCIRYGLKVHGRGKPIAESAIANGVVITTSAGSTGYFSYLDKLTRGGGLNLRGYKKIPEDEIGICHIIPSYTQRLGTRLHPLRYSVPWGSVVELVIARPVDARLYGVGSGRQGTAVNVGDQITVGPSRRTTTVVRPKPA